MSLSAKRVLELVGEDFNYCSAKIPLTCQTKHVSIKKSFHDSGTQDGDDEPVKKHRSAEKKNSEEYVLPLEETPPQSLSFDFADDRATPVLSSNGRLNGKTVMLAFGDHRSGTRTMPCLRFNVELREAYVADATIKNLSLRTVSDYIDGSSTTLCVWNRVFFSQNRSNPSVFECIAPVGPDSELIEIWIAQNRKVLISVEVAFGKNEKAYEVEMCKVIMGDFKKPNLRK